MFDLVVIQSFSFKSIFLGHWIGSIFYHMFSPHTFHFLRNKWPFASMLLYKRKQFIILLEIPRVLWYFWVEMISPHLSTISWRVKNLPFILNKEFYCYIFPLDIFLLFFIGLIDNIFQVKVVIMSPFYFEIIGETIEILYLEIQLYWGFWNEDTLKRTELFLTLYKIKYYEVKRA